MARAPVAALAAPAHLAAATDAPAATLVIRVEGVRSYQGLIYVGVCATGFGDKDCPYRSREAASVGTVELRIQKVEPGEYAVAVFQDLNGNGRINRPFFFPTEPYQPVEKAAAQPEWSRSMLRATAAV